MKCPEIEVLLPGYALDALSADERAAVEGHLETCASCRQALAEYQTIGEGLAFVPPPVEPPPALRARLVARIAAPPPRHFWMARLRALLPRLAPTVGAALLLLLAALNLLLWRRVEQVTQVQQTLRRQNQEYETALALLGDPRAQVARIQGEGVEGTLIYDPHGRTAVLTVQGLEHLPEGQDYQLWLIQPDDTRLSGGVFDADPETGITLFVVHAPQTLDSFVGVGVTIEPAGGSPGPTGPRVLGTGL